MDGHKIFIVVDLGYGDSGKGVITDNLVRKYGSKWVVRFSGGAQCGHRVVDPSGIGHVFHQFGSGTLLPDVKTYYSKYALFNPLSLIKEEQQLCEIGIEDGFNRFYLDEKSLITTPYQMYMNRIKECIHNHANGSCGLGINETVVDGKDFPENVLTAKDLLSKKIIREKLRRNRDLKKTQVNDLTDYAEEYNLIPSVQKNIELLYSEQELEDAIGVFHYIGHQIAIVPEEYILDEMNKNETTVFEGSQGVLLDEEWGFFPYCTRAKTTPTNAIRIARSAGLEDYTKVVGCVRAYATRHGAGPFVSENPELTQLLPDAGNVLNTWQGNFRVGWFDLLATQYAVSVCEKVDVLAITNVDRLENFPQLKICNSYEYNYNSQKDMLIDFEIPSFFSQLKNHIVKIKVNSPFDLKYQEELTKMLFNCKPCYSGKGKIKKIENYLCAIQNYLDIPIGITTNGPTADKQILYRSMPPPDGGRYSAVLLGGKLGQS